MCFLSAVAGSGGSVEGIQGMRLYIHTRPGHPLRQETRGGEGGGGVTTTSGQLQWGVGGEEGRSFIAADW